MAILSNMFLSIFVVAATAGVLPQVFGAIAGVIFRGVGWLIRRRTRSRREYVIARARSEEEEHRSPRMKDSTQSLARSQVEDEDGEKVDSSGGAKTASSSDSGGAESYKPDDWDGIIGFFHPFW